jgi:SAM-dependent methyltransferase
LTDTYYYRDKLSGDRLKRVYEVANPRVRQYLDAEIDFVCWKLDDRKRVLEAGCGYGRVLKRISGNGRTVVGIDNSGESLLQVAEFTGYDDRVLLVRSDALLMPFKNCSFDAALCIQNGISSFHIDPESLVVELVRITEPGGTVVMSSYSERFWDCRLEWFEAQAAEGLLGEIDYGLTGNGVIVCKDGFTATTYSAEDFMSIADKLKLNADIIEIDESSLFCVIDVDQSARMK